MPNHPEERLTYRNFPQSQFKIDLWHYQNGTKKHISSADICGVERIDAGVSYTHAHV